MKRRIVEGSYARLKALLDALFPHFDAFVFGHFSDDYTELLTSLRKGVDDDFSGFDIPHSAYRNIATIGKQVQRDALVSKLRQLISYLETVHSASSRIVEIGSAYNLIRDDELKSRCADLLSATDHFDRVINQATQVLEERIRKLVPEYSSLDGVVLVGKAINGEISKSRIRFSDNSSEQDGFAAIFRGLIGAFRNPSHHRFMEGVTREQALQICAFVDNMLSALNAAEIAN